MSPTGGRVDPGYRRVFRRHRPRVTTSIGQVAEFPSLTKARLHAKTIANASNSASWPALVEDPMEGEIFLFVPDETRPFGWNEYGGPEARRRWEELTR